MKWFKSLMASSLLAVLAQPSLAETVKFSFSVPLSYAGTGCKSSTSTSDEKPALSATFTQYDAGNGKPSTSGLPSTACNFAFPFEIPKGFKVSFKMDWQGSVQGKGAFKRKYFIAGQPNDPWVTNDYSQDFTVQDAFAPSLSCNGGQFTLRINSHVDAETNSHIAIDKAQIVAIELKPC